MSRTSPVSLLSLSLVAGLLVAMSAGAQQAADQPTGETTTAELGSMRCSRVPGSGYNLLITSKAEVRCTFSGQGNSEQWYKGNSGVGLGVDLKWNKSQTIRYGVLSSTTKFTPEGDFLNGKYGGAKAEAAVGVGLGAAVLVGGSNDTFALQPAIETSQGAGVAAGISYLNLDSDPLSLARMATPEGGLMSQALYSGYFQLALEHYRQGRWDGSDRFSDKAMEAAAARTVRPEDLPDAGQISDGDLTDLTKARGRLVAALGDNLSFEAPGSLARSQVAFDCWAWGLANQVDAVDVERCRQNFSSEIARVEQAAADARRQRDRIAELLKPRWFTVYFATDSDGLEPFAQKVLADALASAGELDDARIFIGGNTDRAGSKAYNQALSERRAAAVRTALVEGGVPAVWINMGAFGDENPRQLSTNPHDALNRRVDITIQPVTLKPEVLDTAKSS